MRNLLVIVLLLLSSPIRAQEPRPNAQAPAPIPDTPATQPPTKPEAKPEAKPDAPAAPAVPFTGTFKISFDKDLQTTPYSGRVYIALCKDTKQEPRRIMGDWFGQNPVYSMDVKAVEVGGAVELKGDVFWFPKPLADLEPGDYAAQAVARRNLDTPQVGAGVGDLYSDPITISIKPGDSASFEFKLSKSVAEQPFTETDRIKAISFISPSLSKFYGRDITVNASVILPVEYTIAPPETRFPTAYFIGGFGGTHRFASTLQARLPQSAQHTLIVIPDMTCGFGHHVFADSANNGPRGRSFIDEIIPTVEEKFRGAGTPKNRYIFGISSGGWTALWVMINNPELFAGCWSFCPDPVDFRDFQRIDLYAENANMYKAPGQERRPIIRSGEKILAYYDDFCRREWALGPGGQIGSFEAAFSPKGEDGLPAPLFDRKTGDVNHKVALEWEKYDIRLYIERNWKELGPRVKDKIHLYAGSEDNFYLESSVRLLRESMKKLMPEPDIHIVKGMGHDIHRPAMDVMFRVITDKASK